MDFWESVGRLLALGIASGVLAAFPCGVLHRLHLREFKHIDWEGSPLWKKQLRQWRCLDVTFWIFGSAYLAFCILYIVLFMANVSIKDQEAWLVTAAITLGNDLFLAPIVASMGPAILGMVLVFLIAQCHHLPQREALKQLFSRGESVREPSLVKAGSSADTGEAADLDTTKDHPLAAKHASKHLEGACVPNVTEPVSTDSANVTEPVSTESFDEGSQLTLDAWDLVLEL